MLIKDMDLCAYSLGAHAGPFSKQYHEKPDGVSVYPTSFFTHLVATAVLSHMASSHAQLNSPAPACAKQRPDEDRQWVVWSS